MKLGIETQLNPTIQVRQRPRPRSINNSIFNADLRFAGFFKKIIFHFGRFPAKRRPALNLQLFIDLVLGLGLGLGLGLCLAWIVGFS